MDCSQDTRETERDFLLSTADKEQALRHVSSIIKVAVAHQEEQAALLVYDQRCDLAQVLQQAYQSCLPDAQSMDFDALPAEAILQAFAALPAGSLVVLIQSTHFRLEAYRLRVELFKRGLKVIEHPHLSRMRGEEARYYLDALAYDAAYFRGVGAGLKIQIDQAQQCVLESGAGAKLIFSGGLESAKLNVGDYRQMDNVGGMFPIGEVFTEARDLESVHGSVRIFVFGDTSFLVNQPAMPITLCIEKGRVVNVLDSTPDFDAVLAKIRADEGEVWLRELGFGLNRALTATRLVRDIGTYERMCGVHLSLGAKHGVYSKPNIRRATARYHIDVFAVTERVLLDGNCVYQDGAWLV